MLTDVFYSTLILWPPDAKNWLIWKDPDAGKDWRWEEKGTTEDNLVGWHHRVWVNSEHWWWTGRSGMVQSVGLQHVRHGWVTELNWTEFFLRGQNVWIIPYLLSALINLSLKPVSWNTCIRNSHHLIFTS